MRTIFIMLMAASVSFGCMTPKLTTDQREILKKQIDSMYKADQSSKDVKPVDSAVARYQRAIHSNFPLVKAIFDQYGYPGYSLIGKEASDQYFLLVQHSDFEPAFQQQVLRSMKTEVFHKNASGSQYAFLTDRVEINAGRPQVYGTQVIMGLQTQIKPCRDTANLDKRRLKVGLEPIHEYLERCNQVFRELNPTER